MKQVSRLLNLSVLTAAMALSVGTLADSFTLTSSDIGAGKTMNKAQEYQGFGCTGDNQSPQLSWRGAPKGTQAFALLVHDPDAPTGSGWWHWQLVNIPANTSELASGAGRADSELLPEGTLTIRNDYGSYDFGGACPPEGHGVHRYQFKLHALSKRLALPENPSAALVGYMVNAHSLGMANIEALYER